MKQEYQYKVVRFRKLNKNGDYTSYWDYSEFDVDKHGCELSSVEDKMFAVKLKDHFTKKIGAVCRNITPSFVNYYVPYSISNKIDWSSIQDDKAMVKLFDSYM